MERVKLKPASSEDLQRVVSLGRRVGLLPGPGSLIIVEAVEADEEFETNKGLRESAHSTISYHDARGRSHDVPHDYLAKGDLPRCGIRWMGDAHFENNGMSADKKRARALFFDQKALLLDDGEALVNGDGKALVNIKDLCWVLEPELFSPRKPWPGSFEAYAKQYASLVPTDGARYLEALKQTLRLAEYFRCVT